MTKALFVLLLCAACGDAATEKGLPDGDATRPDASAVPDGRSDSGAAAQDADPVVHDAGPQPPPNVFVTVGTQVTGRLQTFLSTTIQPETVTVNFFKNFPQALTLLGNRNIQHLHLQPHNTAIPLQAANQWDFTNVDSLIQPILSLGDKSPQYHALSPTYLLSCDAKGDCQLPTANFTAYAGYMQDLVRYYNTGGFTVSGHHFQSPSSIHIPYWALFDEPNINGFTGARYAQFYNTVAPAIKAVDPTLHIVALEMDAFDGTDFSSFVNSFATGADFTKAPADAVGIHYYASCDQTDTDQDLLLETGTLISQLATYRAALKGTPIASTPFWLTENNVNADFDAGDGTSNCNPGQRFVPDARGTSAFFAAWRPYTFSQVAQSPANVAGFFQFQYPASLQYGEVNLATGTPYLSYWVDLWLDEYLGYRLATAKGSGILSLKNSDAADVEVLAVKRDIDGSVVVMIANHALRSPSDNNGPGVSRTVAVDLSAFPGFHSATVLTIDKDMDLATGPAPVAVAPAATLTVTLSGYGVSFLLLK